MSLRRAKNIIIYAQEHQLYYYYNNFRGHVEKEPKRYLEHWRHRADVYLRNKTSVNSYVFSLYTDKDHIATSFRPRDGVERTQAAGEGSLSHRGSEMTWLYDLYQSINT